MNAILSIKPQYANAILSGNKTVEFRKAVFKQEVEQVYIYSSSPEKRVVGYFTIESIDKAPPEVLWERYREEGSIDKDAFFAYYAGKTVGYAIRIKKVTALDLPVDPKGIIAGFKAPQSYCYTGSIF